MQKHSVGLVSSDFQKMSLMGQFFKVNQKYTMHAVNYDSETNDSYELVLFSETKIYSITSLIPKHMTLIKRFFLVNQNIQCE